MADPKGSYFKDPVSGQKVFSRGGETFVKDRSGNLFTVGNDAAGDRLLSGEFFPATAEDVRARDLQKEHGGAAGQAKAAAKAVAAGAVDAVTAIPRGLGTMVAVATDMETRDPLGPALGGRQVQENVAGVLSELTGGDNALAAAQEYSDASRAQAEANPLTTAAGYAGGQLGAAALTGGSSLAQRVGAALTRGSKVGRLAVGGALEGGAMGIGASGEAAFIQDSELTAEQMLAGMGLGAFIGGGVGLGLGGAGKLFGRARSRGATPLDSPALDAPDAAVEATAQRALGDVPAAPGLAGKLRDALEDAQAAVAGVDRQALGEVGATRGFLDPKSSAYKGRSLWWRRDAIREDGTAKLTSALEQAAADADDVLDNVVDAGLKRSHIAPKLTGDQEAMVAAGRAEFQRLREELGTALARGDDFGNQRLLLRQHKYLEAIEPNITGSRAAGAETRDMAADTFIALDRAKRAIQKDVKALRSSAGRSGNALEQMQSRQLADYLEGVQERVRSGLEDTALWGEAGAAQKAINARWGEYLRTQQTFRDAFLRRVEGPDYQTGRPVYRVDPDKVASYIRKTGRQEGKLVDEYFRRHVDAREALAREISGAFETGADEAARLTQSSAAIRKTLGELDETARAVNQVEAIMEAEGSSGTAGLGALVGGVLGGAPGAAIGGLLGAAARPGTMIRQAAAIEQLARNVNLKLERGVTDFFERAASPVRQLLPKGVAAATSKIRPLPTVTALELFRGKEADNQKAYRKRARELLASTGNYGEGIRQRSEEALGGLATEAPKLSQAMTATATRGAEFLKSKLPAPLVDTKSLTPNSTPPIVSDLEIAEFARYWSAVSNPLSVIDDLRRGTVTAEQVEAVRMVYPKLYQLMQDTVRAQLMKLDEKGAIVPYQARLQLDLLLDLNGAGEETASVEFMVRYQQAAATAPDGGKPRPEPPAQPVNLSVAATASGSSKLLTTANEST